MPEEVNVHRELRQKRCISVKSLEFISAGINLSIYSLIPFSGPMREGTL